MFNNIKVGAISCAAGGAGWAAFLFWFVSQNISIAEAPWILLGGAATLIALGSWIFTVSWRRVQLSGSLYMSLGILALGTTLVAVGLIGVGISTGNLFLLVILGEAVVSLGLVAFGLMSFTDRKFARWGWLPLLMMSSQFLVSNWWSFSITSLYLFGASRSVHAHVPARSHALNRHASGAP